MTSVRIAEHRTCCPCSRLLAPVFLVILMLFGVESLHAAQSSAPRIQLQKQGHKHDQKKDAGQRILGIDASRGSLARLSVYELLQLADGDRVLFTPPASADGTQPDEIALRVSRARILGQGRRAWQLVGETDEFMHAQFVLRGSVMAGAINGGGEVWWRLLSNDEHFVSVETITQAELPPCGGVQLPDHDPGQDGDGPDAGGLAQSGAEICSGSCQESTIDLGIFYTTLAREASGGVQQIETLCELAVAQANAGFENSDSDTRIRIVYLGEVDYDDENESNHLGHLANGSDGQLDEVQAIMAYTGADVASLIVEFGEGYCGVAFLGPARYHVNVRFCLGGFVLAHEFGHNLGACHACGDGGGCGCGGYLDYSVGWRFLGNSSLEWRTIMAYSPGSRIPHFSNPDILHDGQPTGVPVGETDEADNVTTFEITSPMVSAFACPPAYLQTIKLLPSDAAQLDLFGQSVAVVDDRVIVGAYLADEVATNSGSTYVFSPGDPSEECPPDPYGYDSDTCYIESAKPPVFGVRQDDGVGRAVAAHGLTMVTGASLRDIMTVDKKGEEIIDIAQAGSVFVYDRSGDSWCLTQELTSSDPAENDRFGTAVDIDDATIVVGVPRRDVDADGAAGAIEIFEYVGGSSGSPWAFTTLIEGDPDALTDGAQFGAAVAVDGMHLAVGAPYAINGKGAVRMYRKTGSAWTFLQQLELPVGSGETNFGQAVAISGDTCLVGAPLADSGDGRAYLYSYDGASWIQAHEFTPLGGEDDSQFGFSVALDADYGLIGAPRSPAPAQDILDAGAVFMIKRVETNWYLVGILSAFDAEAGDQYGLSVAVNGETVAVGAGYDNDNGIQSGSVYVYPFGPLVDCNDNGYGDTIEILQGISFDNNGNGIPDPCDCVGDMNFDGVVDGFDLTFFLDEWGNMGSDLRADVNLDGVVDGFDLTILLGTWGECPDI